MSIYLNAFNIGNSPEYKDNAKKWRLKMLKHEEMLKHETDSGLNGKSHCSSLPIQFFSSSKTINLKIYSKNHFESRTGIFRAKNISQKLSIPFQWICICLEAIQNIRDKIGMLVYKGSKEIKYKENETFFDLKYEINNMSKIYSMMLKGTWMKPLLEWSAISKAVDYWQWLGHSMLFYVNTSKCSISVMQVSIRVGPVFLTLFCFVFFLLFFFFGLQSMTFRLFC